MADTAFDTGADSVPFLPPAAPPAKNQDRVPAQPAVPPLQSLDDLTAKVSREEAGLLKEKIGAEGGMAAAQKRRDVQYRERMNRALAAESATADELKPWNASEELAKRQTSLWDQFGSPGFVVAMIGSAFTAMPMNSALNAGAAAMNAINQGNMDDYNKSFDAWKENTRLVEKRLDLEERQFNQIDKLRSSDMESYHSQMTTLLNRFNDQRKLIMWNAGMNSEVEEALASQFKTRADISDARERIEKNETRRQLTMVLAGDKPTPQKLAQAAVDAEDIMSGSARTPEGLVVRNLISQPGFRDLPVAEQNKQIQDAVAGISSARYGGHTTPANAEINRRLNDWDQTHKDASPDERDAAHLKIMNEVAVATKGRPDTATNSKDALQQWTDMRGAPPTPEMKAIISSAYNTKSGLGGARVAQIGAARTEIQDRLAKGEQLDDAAQEKILREAVQQAPTGMTLDKESADLIADQYLAGDRMAAAGFARSAQNMAMIRKSIQAKAKEQNMTGADIAMKIAEFHGIMSAETTVGRRLVTIEMFANEARRVINVAKKASKEVPRGEFIPFNEAMLAFEKKTGDTKVVALGSALNAVINTYAKAINGGQQGTVSDKDHAREIVEMAYSDKQIDAVFNILEQELVAAQAAPGDVKQGLRDLQSGKIVPKPDEPNVIRYDASGNRVK